MPTPVRSARARWFAGTTAACLSLFGLALLTPMRGPVTIAIALAAVAVGAGIGASRQAGLDRVGWALMAVASGAMAVATLVFRDDFAGTGMCAAGVLNIYLVAVALLCFLARAPGDILGLYLQSANVATTIFICLWMFGEPAAVRWTDSPLSQRARLADIALAVGVLALVHAVAAAVTRRDASRMPLALVAAALSFGLGADVIQRAAVEGQLTGEALWATRVPQIALFLVAGLAAAFFEPTTQRRPRLERTQDLTLLSIVTLAAAAVIAATAGTTDRATARALAAIVIQLVLTHLNEAYRSRRLTASIERQERHLRLLVSESRDVIIELDAGGRIVFASEALRNILGHRLSEVAGDHISTVVPDLTPAALAGVAYADGVRVQATMRVESVLTTTGGSLVHVESVVTPLPQGYIVAARDVTERVGLTSRLAQVTYHDITTGLPNRSSLDRELRSRRYEAASGDIALVLVEAVAGPGAIGDDAQGDLHRHVGTVLPAQMRPGDMVARLSDHRFAVLLRAGTSSQAAVAEASRLVAAVGPPSHLRELDLRVTAGVFVGSQNGANILRDAELALGHTQPATDPVALFEPGMRAQHARAQDLRRLLAKTPDTSRWTVLYQPVVDLQSGSTTGVEALLRWTDPEGDFIGIEEVIALAEEYGSIIQIGALVLDQAVGQAARWAEGGWRLQTAVNVSVHQLKEAGFARLVADTLTRHGLEPGLLTLEITETVVLDLTTETLSTLTELRGLGVKIAIDDFGTGYSGLANIRNMPLDILKIDRTFIQGLGTGGSDEAVVNAVTHLGHELGVAITAEGIETHEQERLARSLGITAAQGYLYSRPIPPADVTALVARSAAATQAAAQL